MQIDHREGDVSEIVKSVLCIKIHIYYERRVDEKGCIALENGHLNLYFTQP